MFVNYFRDETRTSPLNLAVARVLLAGYLIWKTVWYDWSLLYSTPYVGFESYSFAIPPTPAVLVVEKWVLIGLLVAVAVGYRLGATTFLSALLVAHLGMVRFTLAISGGTTALFFSAYFLIMFGLYRDQDVLTVDGVRRARGRLADGGTVDTDSRRSALTGVVGRLAVSGRGSYSMSALKWNLVTIAFIYFGAGLDKLLTAGFAWMATDNLRRILLVWSTIYSHPIPLGAVMVDYPLVVSAAAVGTLVLELGLLVAVLARAPITLFVLGIVGMQVVIAVAMGPFFFDVFVFFAMFLAWDSIYERVKGWWGGRSRSTAV